MVANLGMGVPFVTDYTRPITPVAGVMPGDDMWRDVMGVGPAVPAAPLNLRGARTERREAPQAAPMDIAPIVQAELPQAPSPAPQPVAAPQATPGGLGGLGGFGDTLSALGRSMMSSPNGWWTRSYGDNMDALEQRRMQEAERTRKEQAEVAERQALGAALVDSGVFPSMEAASRYMASPDGLRVMMEARERERLRQEDAATFERMYGSGTAPEGQPSPNSVEFPLGFRTDPALQATQPGAQAAPAPAAQPAPVAGSDPMAVISRLNAEIEQQAVLASRYGEDTRTGAMARARMATLEQQRDMLAKQMPDDIAPTYGVIGTDAYGNQQYGWVDRQARTVTPAQTAAAAQVGESPIPPPPLGVDPATWRREQTERLLAEQNPQPDVKGEGDLRGEIRSLPSFRNYEQARPIFESMVAAAQRNTKAADLNLVVGLGKLFDPTSVVREGEMVMVQDAQGVGQRLMALFAEVNQGARLSPQLRAELMAEGESRMQQYESAIQRDLQQYRAIAEQYGYDPSRIAPNYGPLPDFDPQTVGGLEPGQTIEINGASITRID